MVLVTVFRKQPPVLGLVRKPKMLKANVDTMKIADLCIQESVINSDLLD